jgi:hypothetical protein
MHLAHLLRRKLQDCRLDFLNPAHDLKLINISPAFNRSSDHAMQRK